MPKLAEVQAAFAQSLLDGDDRVIEGLIVAGELGVRRRLDIYRNNRASAVKRALEGAYPVVAALGGAAFFTQLARDYCKAHPPADAHLIDYGGAMPEFLGFYPAVKAHPYFADVARLEWLWWRAYIAQDAANFDPARLLGLDPLAIAALRFTPHPSLHLMTSRWPVDEIWRSARTEIDGGRGAVVDIGQGPVHLMVARPFDGVAITRLSPDEHAWLEALISGASLQQALGAVSLDFALDAALARHFSLGSFVDFRRE